MTDKRQVAGRGKRRVAVDAKVSQNRTKLILWHCGQDKISGQTEMAIAERDDVHFTQRKSCRGPPGSWQGGRKPGRSGHLQDVSARRLPAGFLSKTRRGRLRARRRKLLIVTKVLELADAMSPRASTCIGLAAALGMHVLPHLPLICA